MNITPLMRFTLPIAPVPKARPRFAHGRAYSDPKSVAFENEFIYLALKHRPEKPLSCDIALVLTFTIERPPSVKRPFPSVRPDLDNYVKGVKDAMNKVFYIDDAQVVATSAKKIYGATGSIEVQIARVETIGVVT